MLGNYFRVIVFNNSGTNSGGAGTVTVKKRGWWIGTTGVPNWSAVATIFSNAALISTGAYNTADATAFNNAGAGNPEIGAEFECRYDGTGSPTGPVNFILQRSVDGGSTWPDNGQGEIIATLNPTAAATYRTVVEYD